MINELNVKIFEIFYLGLSPFHDYPKFIHKFHNKISAILKFEAFGRKVTIFYFIFYEIIKVLLFILVLL